MARGLSSRDLEISGEDWQFSDEGCQISLLGRTISKHGIVFSGADSVISAEE